VSAYYPLLSLLSMIAFAGLGYVLATKRGRSGIGWAIGGAIFPPLLLIFFFVGERKMRGATISTDDPDGDDYNG